MLSFASARRNNVEGDRFVDGVVETQNVRSWEKSLLPAGGWGGENGQSVDRLWLKLSRKDHVNSLEARGAASNSLPISLAGMSLYLVDPDAAGTMEVKVLYSVLPRHPAHCTVTNRHSRSCSRSPWDILLNPIGTSRKNK
jgi:hypothetical protein